MEDVLKAWLHELEDLGPFADLAALEAHLERMPPLPLGVAEAAPVEEGYLMLKALIQCRRRHDSPVAVLALMNSA